MRKPFVLAFVVLVICVSTIVNSQAIRGEISATLTNPQSERFSVSKEFWAFSGSYRICSFGTSSGDYIVLNISSINIDPDRPNDRYVVDLEIASINHGTFYVSGTQFTQTITLNYSDSYTITADKHQFWSSVRISGELTVYHNPVPIVTNSPSPSPVPTLKPTLLPIPYPSNSPELPEFPPLVILPLLIALFPVIVVKLLRKHR